MGVVAACPFAATVGGRCSSRARAPPCSRSGRGRGGSHRHRGTAKLRQLRLEQVLLRLVGLQLHVHVLGRLLGLVQVLRLVLWLVHEGVCRQVGGGLQCCVRGLRIWVAHVQQHALGQRGGAAVRRSRLAVDGGHGGLHVGQRGRH